MVCRTITTFLFSLCLFLSSCQQPDQGINDDTGRLILRLTDAPFPHNKVSEVNVTISAITLELNQQAKANHTESDSSLDLLDSPIKVNLLKLTNGITLALANIDIPTGSYNTLKVSLKETEIVLIDKTVYDLTPRANQMQGMDVVLNSPFDVKAGLTTDLLLDFDVSRSFVPRMSPTANMGIAGFIFNPVIHLSDNSNSGSLSGIITSTADNKISRIYGAQVSIISADTLVTNTFTDKAGMYTVLGLKPGNYEVRAEFENHSTSSPKFVNVLPDQLSQLSLVLQTGS